MEICAFLPYLEDKLKFMRIFACMCLLFLWGCMNNGPLEQSKAQINLEFNKQFKQEHHLFLNYYFGMSVADYESATQLNFTNKEILLSGENDACALHGFNHKHTLEDIQEINKHSIVYYEFNLGNEEFEAVVKPVFRNDKLIRIELQTLNCFTFGNHSHEFYRRKINDTRQALLQMHTEKYGNYQIQRKVHNQHEKDVIKNEGVAIETFDTNKYVFSHNNKRITIEQKCCDFKPLVIYTLEKNSDNS